MMHEKDENKQRQRILELIRQRTPKEYQTQAQKFSETATKLKISPNTLNSVFNLVSTTDVYNLQTLKDIEFKGVFYNVNETSALGQKLKDLAVRFENKEGQQISLGWETTSKLFQAIQNTDLVEVPRIQALGAEIKESELEQKIKEQDISVSINEIREDPQKIKDVRSYTEKRQVSAVLGLEEEIKKVENYAREKLKELLLEKDFFDKVASHYVDALLPVKGIIKRVDSYENLPAHIAESLNLLKYHKDKLTVEDYSKNVQVLRTWDFFVTPLEAEGYLRGYLSDLRELAQKDKITGDKKDIILATQKLYEQKRLMTMSEMLPILALYDSKKERNKVFEEELNKSKDYQEDFEKGIKQLEKYFIQGTEWRGGRGESIPREITKALEGKVKSRGDKKLKNAQKWFRSKYSNKEFVHTKSFEEIRQETESIVVLARRQNEVSDTQRPTEAFKEKYDLSLEEFTKRANDLFDERISDHKEYFQNKRQIEHLLSQGVWDEKHFESEKSQELIEKIRPYIEYTDELKEKVNTYYDLIKKSRITQDEIKTFSLSRGNKYIESRVTEALLEITNKQKIIEQNYKRIEQETKTTIQQNQLLIKNMQEYLQEAPLTQEYKITITGTTYQERHLFQKEIREKIQDIYWKDKKWTAQINKAKIGNLLETMKQYNEKHNGNLKIEIIRPVLV